LRSFRTLVFCLCVASSAAGVAAEPVHRAVVVSIDGLGASELRGAPRCLSPASMLVSLAREGAVARGMRGVLPTITYPTHASMVSGVPPRVHGIVDNAIGGRWISNRAELKADTLWDAARRAGLRVAIVTWPTTYGANVDFLVPEDLVNEEVPTPRIRAGATPGLFDALAAGVGMPRLLPFADPAAGERMDEMTASFAAELVRRERPDLLLAHFLDYDHRMHEAPYSSQACAALARIDRHLARLRDAYRDAGILAETTFFVVSDHGFLEVGDFIDVFSLLRAAGWEGDLPAANEAFAIRNAGGSVAFYPGPAWRVESRAAVRRLRARIESRFGNLVRWLDPAQALAFGGFPDALFVLCARRGYAFTVRPGSGLFRQIPGVRGMHGYCPDEPRMDGLFIASGAGIAPGTNLGSMSAIDVGPTVAAWLGAHIEGASGRQKLPGTMASPMKMKE
jgi:predicted AlkP superfamily pyrophosphatase or phosphodiesterase